MKGKCPICEKIVDETEYIQGEEMCIHCYNKERTRIGKKIKDLCEILEIDHLGLICEGVKRLMKEYNRIFVSKKESKQI